VTRERPKIDRIACPWLIRRLLDPDARFLYVPAKEVGRVAAETGATPYDVPDVEFTHVGNGCSFDAFIARYGLADPALLRLADIVRGADIRIGSISRRRPRACSPSRWGSPRTSRTTMKCCASG